MMQASAEMAINVSLSSWAGTTLADIKCGQ
jgi:hypothetical protein